MKTKLCQTFIEVGFAKSVALFYSTPQNIPFVCSLETLFRYRAKHFCMGLRIGGRGYNIECSTQRKAHNRFASFVKLSNGDDTTKSLIF